jgi:hypothetical protein
VKYRDFAKDYEINYVSVPGQSRLKAIRVYKGPYFSFLAPPERIRFLRWYYFTVMILLAFFLIVPMCIDCAFTRAWYIQVPSAVAWIPFVLAVGAVWRLWTAKEKVDREHCELLYNRMSSSALFLIIFCGVSSVGCIGKMVSADMSVRDWIVGFCCIASEIISVSIFAARKDLKMIQLEKA